MTYSEITSACTPTAKYYIDNAVFQKEITESEVVNIVCYTFEANRKGNYVVNTELNRLIFILDILRSIRLKYRDAKNYKDTINRLLAKKGIEAANELIMHRSLLELFSGYRINFPLFGNNADGELITDSNRISVEIKSRFPEKYDILNDFISSLHKTLPNHSWCDWTYEIRINNIKGLNKNTSTEELDFIKKTNYKLDFDQIKKHIQTRYISSTIKIINNTFIYNFEIKNNISYTQGKRSNSGFEFELILVAYTSKRNKKSITLYTPNDAQLINPEEEKYLISYMTPKLDTSNRQLSGSQSISAVLSEDVKKYLADEIVTVCIKKAKNRNLPEEPRLLAIYCSHGTDNMGFLKQVADNYINRHNGTAILILDANFNDIFKNSRIPFVESRGMFSIKYFNAGLGIKSDLIRSLKWYEADTNITSGTAELIKHMVT